MTQKIDRKEIFPPATCSKKDCLSPYAKWCRDCNLVYCGICIENHPCKPEDQAARRLLYETQEEPCPPQP